MGISSKSHGKKSDKETQSPALKIIRDFLQRDKNDPEKMNLLKSKQSEKRRKKHYPGSRTKSDNKTVESSCSDRRGAPYIRHADFESTRTRSNPFQGEKKESWWFWGDQDVAKPSEDTCSCVSCALKKIISTDYVCIGCLVLLFAVSVVVAFLLVYKSIPCLSDSTGSEKSDVERPKRKIDGLSKFRWDHLGKNSIGGKKRDTEVFSYGAPSSMDFGSNLRDLDGMIDSNSDLYKILDSNLMEEIQSSDRLKDFYKKLIQTDAQIRKLKKNNELSMTSIDNIVDKYRSFPDRAKRSLKIFHKPMKMFEKPMKLFHFKKNKKVKDASNEQMNDDNVKNKVKPNVSPVKGAKLKNKGSRNKRFDNTSEPESFVIENKKILIQYKPNRKSKCSHAPKESKSHENQLKHPFYQNTQRLDELLDRFLDRNLPDIVANQFGLDLLFGNQKNKCKHPKVDADMSVRNEKKIPEKFSIKKAVTLMKEVTKNNREISPKKVDGDFTKTLMSGTTKDTKKITSTTIKVNLLPTIASTKHDSNNYKRTSYPHNPLLDRAPNARKLLQTDVDDDINEVMVGNDAHDKMDRNKRANEPILEDIKDKFKVPASILNPNWKGPMPLYPDELNSMVKPIVVNRVETPVNNKYNSENDEDPIVGNKDSQIRDDSEADENFVNRFEVSVQSKDSAPETDEFEADVNDMEYIEDYFRNKYDRLVEMAQAYSDYGVLESKKAATEKKVDEKIKLEGPDHRVKLALKGFKKRFKNNIFRRPKKGSQDSYNTNQPNQFTNQSEGFRLEILPTSEARDDNPTQIYKTLQKHIKVSNCKPKFHEESTPSDNIDLLTYSTRLDGLKTTKKLFTISNENGLLFSVGKSMRSLKSIELADDNENEELPETNAIMNKDDAVIDGELNIRNVLDNKREVSNYTSNDTATNTTMKLAADVKNSTDKLNASNAAGIAKLDKEDKLNINTGMSLSNFFMLVSNWFSVLNGTDNIILNDNPIGNISPSEVPTELVNKTDNISYPTYDSDVIENIGHRSRMLLSIGDNITDKVINKADEGNEGMNNLNVITDSINTSITNIQTPKTTDNDKVKTIVKRNADDSNLIFWNDLYDDEYGVAVDHFENNVRDKHSVGKNDFMKVSNEWFHDKMRQFAESLHKKANSLRKEHKNDPSLKKKENHNNNDAVINNKSKETDSIYTRISRKADGPAPAKKTDFAALTANMKKICRKAAKDMSKANKVDVREVGKEGQVASTLMQQLVRLMGDLVDYQVQQRTCRILPPELQSFLEWLTSSPETSDKINYRTDENPESDFGRSNDKPEEEHNLGMETSSEKEEGPYSRSGCLGTLQAVEALLRQYEDLADDEKSKMTGVKEYLESQLLYLQTQVTSVHDYTNLYNTARFRRDVTEKKTKNQKRKKLRNKLKQAMANFARKFSKKHENSNSNDKTINNNAKNMKNDGLKTKKEKVKESEGSGTIKEKRNLRDVYYKALADSKKITTAKGHGK